MNDVATERTPLVFAADGADQRRRNRTAPDGSQGIARAWGVGPVAGGIGQLLPQHRYQANPNLQGTRP